MKALALLCGVALAGCGGPVPLDPGMEGEWFGFLSVDTSSKTVDTFSTVRVHVLDAKHAEVSGFCPNGDGAVVVDGEGGAASWAGEVACAPFMEGECSVVLTYRALSLQFDGSLFLDGEGSGMACATETPFTTSFVGAAL
jgi:hypothetical protein